MSQSALPRLSRASGEGDFATTFSPVPSPAVWTWSSSSSRTRAASEVPQDHNIQSINSISRPFVRATSVRPTSTANTEQSGVMMNQYVGTSSSSTPLAQPSAPTAPPVDHPLSRPPPIRPNGTYEPSSYLASPLLTPNNGLCHPVAGFVSGISNSSAPSGRSTGPINQPFQRPKPAPVVSPITSAHIKLEDVSPKSHAQLAPKQNMSDHFRGYRAPLSTVSSGTMLPPPIPSSPSATSLGKRKAIDEDGTRFSSNPSIAPPPVKRERLSSSTPDLKPMIPIPILPLPLPSKRFKKHPTAKALLIPVEQLPVFALPPLPTIEDPTLAKQVFTHQSLFERQRGRFEDPQESPARHYEKLEHVGDSILGMIVTTWLHETKPNLTIGTATKLKAHLVSNATLSHISGMYNLPQRLNGDPNLLPVLRAQTDVRAALVEAYIAALYFSFPAKDRLGEGVRTIDDWLREMYEPLYDFFYNYMRKEYEQHHTTVGAGMDGMVQVQSEEEIARIDTLAQGMAKLVEMYAAAQERELRWEEERCESNLGALWKIRCTVDGIELGEATRSYKKAAKNVAGWEAAKKLGITGDT